MAAAITEEARIEVPGGLLTGQWDFPKSLPPMPLGVLFPWHPEAGLEGSVPWTPRLRPAGGLARAATAAGLAFFRVSSSGVPVGVTSGLPAIWRRAVDHHLVSRSRVGLILPRALVLEVFSVLPEMRAHRTPQALVLVDPPDGVQLAAAAGIEMDILLAGSSSDGDAASRAQAFAGSAVRAGVPLRTHVIPDLTEHGLRRSDWFAGRPIVHPLLVETVIACLRRNLRPPWDPGIRPPGTAIGF